jgi:hypothetical protein
MTEVFICLYYSSTDNTIILNFFISLQVSGSALGASRWVPGFFLAGKEAEA